jgi:hypothetical protein
MTTERVDGLLAADNTLLNQLSSFITDDVNGVMEGLKHA